MSRRGSVAADSLGQLFGLADEIPTLGRHSGYAKVPFPTGESAYGFIPVPLVVIGGGKGPTILLLAGVFGDEPEAQVALTRLIQELDFTKMNGRVIAMPMANTPAARAGTRNSPIDGRNLNRSFPGDVIGTPTSIIADYIEKQLMSISDIVIDLHSDSRSLRYVPGVTCIDHADPSVRSKRLSTALAFGAPNLIIFQSFEDRNTSGAARRAGAVRIATEMGGPDPINMTVAGIKRVMRWAGIISEAPKKDVEPTIHVIPQDQCFVYSMNAGVFVPACILGQAVSTLQTAGYIYDPMHPLTSPVSVPFSSSGTVVCTRGPGLTSVGDCLMHLGVPPSKALLAECEDAQELFWLLKQPEAHARSRKQGTARTRK